MSEKAAETGECLYAARRIDEENADTWIDEWAALAGRVEALGDESLRGGHGVSARESYLRACNYWRTAEYACTPSHPRFTETWRRSVAAFHKACPLLTPKIQTVEVPFEGKMLPGYFARPDDSDAKRPTIFIVGGNDSSLEQMVIGVGFAALRRGYNIFSFDYPGHRGAVHLYPSLVKRSDYSTPFSAALDVLGGLPGVDERVALTGYSYGGYVASQVATREKRVKALIPDSPLIDLPALQRSSPFSQFFKLIPDKLLDGVVESKLKKAVVIKGLTYYTIWSWGCPNFVEWKNWDTKMRNVLDDELRGISCPTLALVSAHEGEVMVQQAKTFIEKIGSENKKLHAFTLERDGSYDHCQLDNLSRGQQVMYDWLDDVFKTRSA
jgi:pimeloyl-ACP methyl ester carboxylesterase